MKWETDKTLIVLCFFVVLFVSITLALVIALPKEISIQTVFIGMLGGAWSALLLYLKLEKPLPPGSTIVSKSEQTTKIPPVESVAVPPSV